MTQARRSFVIAFTSAFLWVVQAVAQPYPSRPITIIVPSAAGGLSDAFVRLIGDTIQGAWGQPVVMDPRSGAGTLVISGGQGDTISRNRAHLPTESVSVGEACRVTKA